MVENILNILIGIIFGAMGIALIELMLKISNQLEYRNKNEDDS